MPQSSTMTVVLLGLSFSFLDCWISLIVLSFSVMSCGMNYSTASSSQILTPLEEYFLRSGFDLFWPLDGSSHLSYLFAGSLQQTSWPAVSPESWLLSQVPFTQLPVFLKVLSPELAQAWLHMKSFSLGRNQKLSGLLSAFNPGRIFEPELWGCLWGAMASFWVTPQLQKLSVEVADWIAAWSALGLSLSMETTVSQAGAKVIRALPKVEPSFYDWGLGKTWQPPPSARLTWNLTSATGRCW